MTTGRADKTRVTGDKEAACLRSGDTGRCHTVGGCESGQAKGGVDVSNTGTFCA